jgi:hypothetical protein
MTKGLTMDMYDWEKHLRLYFDKESKISFIRCGGWVTK